MGNIVLILYAHTQTRVNEKYSKNKLDRATVHLAY